MIIIIVPKKDSPRSKKILERTVYNFPKTFLDTSDGKRTTSFYWIELILLVYNYTAGSNVSFDLPPSVRMGHIGTSHFIHCRNIFNKGLGRVLYWRL